jgi:hypothetical protein
MPLKITFQQEFAEDVAPLFEEQVFKPGTASLHDYMMRGFGDIAEGIRTTMKIGDLQLFGSPGDAPEETSVAEDYAYFYEGKQMAPLASLLPTLTVSGTAETMPGFWKVLFDSEKSRMWAFLRMLKEMKVEGDGGVETKEARLKKIMTDLLADLPVVIVMLKEEDELWAEWSRSQTTGHTDLQHSVDRNSVRFIFFAKLKQTLKNQLKSKGEEEEVTSKELFQAYQDAESQQKFKTAKGMIGVKRDNELSQLIKWGEFVTKCDKMDTWRGIEVFTEGKTAFFTPFFSNSFCKLVDNDEDIAKYVLNTLEAKIKDEKWRKKVLEANVQRMKSIVKTLVLEWKWAKSVVYSCKSKPIMSPEKMAEDFAVIESAFNMSEALKITEDSTGKKANLHPLSLELWDMCRKVLVDQAQFNTFQVAESLNKNFTNTVQTEALENLCLPNIMLPWKDAQTQFVGHQKKAVAAQADDENEEENKVNEKASVMQLPTRKEAIKAAAKNELDLYHGTSFVKTGDVTRDRQKMFECELTKPRTSQTAQWNSETRGNRRASIYDEKGRRNPKWTYVRGRNRYRSKVSFQKDDMEDFVDTWAIMAKPGDGPPKEKVDVIMVWNAEQERASVVISKKLKSIPGLEGRVKKTMLKGVQAHVERRLWEGAPEGEVGELAGLPGMQEELFEGFAGPLPSRRKHILPMGGIIDNMYPEEIVPLSDPKTSEPVVTVEVQKAIFPPDDDKPHDGEKVVRSDEVWAPCCSLHV